MVMLDHNETIQRQYRLFEAEMLPQIDALYTFAYHLTYNEADADDLVQDTYLRAWKAIHQYNEGTNVRAWLFTILKHTFINKHRREKSRPTQVELTDLVKPAESKKGASENILVKDSFRDAMGDEVTQAINDLPVAFRLVILLCDIEGFTYEEIAAILSIPVGTVRSRLHRGRNLLKAKLKDYGRSMGYGKEEAA